MTVAKEGLAPHWSAGGRLTPPDTISTGSTPTGTNTTRLNHTLRNAQSGQFKSITNVIQKWGGNRGP